MAFPDLAIARTGCKCYVSSCVHIHSIMPATPTIGPNGPASIPEPPRSADVGEGTPTLTILPCRTGNPGAEVFDTGVRFAVYSKHARSVHVALYPPGASEPAAVLALPSCHGHVFQGFVPGIGPGWEYGYYAEGPFDPRHGHRFNPRKFLIDPYARALRGAFRNEEGVLCGHVSGAGQDADLMRDHRPSAQFMPRGLVVRGDDFDWQGVEAPVVAREDLVIYEVHVKGMTADPSSGARSPGTFLGLVEKIPHLKSLGVNAVELLPVHAKYSEDMLLEKGLSNYWGYNTASFFALEPSYGSGGSPGCELNEFKEMVRELHRAGILVILDVVYNHTAEGNELGPTLSLRGLDNRSYYSLTGPDDAPRRHYRNHTGCGNTLDITSRPALRLVMDSLRYFAQELRVDGFRFDLATVHGRRGDAGFDPAAPFFTAVAQDPVLQNALLIAEPWDTGTYALGRFPEGWMEWNDDFRDTVRRWVRGEQGLAGALLDKLEGSPEMYESALREPWTSVNFVTAHDGYALRDLVSYDRKHNLANGEENRDGSHANHSWNCGHEGPSEDPGVEAIRARQIRNFILLLTLARGTPMFLGGDELLRTQGGNNNAYCQDGPVSWLQWDEANAGFLRFVEEAFAWRRIIAPANTWGLASSRAWGRTWQGFSPTGKPWRGDLAPESRQVAFLLHARPVIGAWQEHPDPSTGALHYLLLNPGHQEEIFQLPVLPPPWEWRRVADTALPSPRDITVAGHATPLPDASRCHLESRSSVLLRAEQRK